MPSHPEREQEVLTVVVPTLNSAPTLDWTLASLCANSAIRVVVADSFSTDGTDHICRRWNVELISVPPGNMYAAINAGLRTAQTDWLSYVNSDDWVFTSSYVKMLAMAMNSSADVVYGSADYVDESGRFLFSHRPSTPATARRIWQAGIMPFCQPAAIFSRKIFEALNGFDERYKAASDFDFFCRAAMLNYTFRRFDSPAVAAFRLHGNQLSVRRASLAKQERAEIDDRLRLNRGFSDSCAFFLWRLSRSVTYVERILRIYQLSGKLAGRRSSSTPPL
jgi:glycosyltransferase involved in cell wall biosynthesis